MVIGINPGSIWPTKRWSVSRLRACDSNPAGTARLRRASFRGSRRPPSRVGSPETQRRTRQSTWSENIALAELPAAIGLCNVFITNDSGPMHIAAARNVPTVAIFCATTPSLGFYPYSDKAIVLEAAIPCRPCTSHGGRRCPLGTEDCIRMIRPEHVVEAVERLLLRQGTRRARRGSAAGVYRGLTAPVRTR